MKLFNRDKIILDLCGATGAWSKDYKEAGYDVRIITSPDHDVTDYGPPKDVYGVLAAPPCTEFSYAKSWHNSDRNFREGMKPVLGCLRIMNECIYNAWDNKNVGGFKFWCLENPARGYLERFLGKPALVWEPWEYGDPWTKKSAAWGWFKIPKKNQVVPVSTNFAHDKFLQGLPDNYILPRNTTKRAARRSITPPGFAKAFFEANQ